MIAEKIIMVGAIAFVILVIIIVSYIFVSLVPTAVNIIDIQTLIKPIAPYDYAKLDRVVDSNTSRWEIIIKVVDVETNQTAYDRCYYNIQTREFSNYSLIYIVV